MKSILFVLVIFTSLAAFAKADCDTWWQLVENAQQHCADALPATTASCAPVKDCFVKAFDGMPRECWQNPKAKTPYADWCFNTCLTYPDAKLCFQP